MELGPVEIPSGVDVNIKARLDTAEIPYLQVDAGEMMPASQTFDLKVSHNVNGKALGVAKALPVYVYVNGALAIPGFEYGDNVSTSLPAGTYTITVTLLDGTPIPSMTIENAYIPGGVDVRIKAKLAGDGVPFLNVTVK